MARRTRCWTPCGRIRGQPPPERSCSRPTARRSPAPGVCRHSQPPRRERASYTDPRPAPEGTPQPCAWRLQTPTTAAAGAVFLHRLATVQSGGSSVRKVGWMQSSALLVRRAAAAEIEWLDPHFFVYSDETDFQKRLHDAGWHVLYVPQARAVHHEQLSTDAVAAGRRITEFHRGRDLYMRKHHGAFQAAIARVLNAVPYAIRALIPGRDRRRMALHASRALMPARGEGLREAAARFNAGDSVPDPGGKRGQSPIGKRLRS